MSDYIKDNNALDAVCKDYAQDIIAECKRDSALWGWDALQNLQENASYHALCWADDSEHRINSNRALSIIATCDTARGEQWVKTEGRGDAQDFRKFACEIVCGEIYCRIMQHLSTEIDRLAECDELLEEEV